MLLLSNSDCFLHQQEDAVVPIPEEVKARGLFPDFYQLETGVITSPHSPLARTNHMTHPNYKGLEDWGKTYDLLVRSKKQGS